jgi:hypothetical protein
VGEGKQKNHDREGSKKIKPTNRSLDKKWDFKACEARESEGKQKQIKPTNREGAENEEFLGLRRA